MCTTKLVRFGWVEGRVDASEHHVRATIASYFPDLVTAKCIRRVDADADNISSLNVEWVHGIQSFIDQGGITKARRCCRGQDIQPARSNDSCSEGHFAWINKMNAHAASPP
jgi:hypothetical protein